MSVELSIVMPCLNEILTLPTCIRKARTYLETSGVEGEIIVADNGSTDGSIEAAESLGARVVHVPVKGYGAALSAGIHAARGRYVIMGDSDDSYDFLGLQPFVEKLREGYELVMGNRFKGGIQPGAMPFMHRFVGNPMLSALGRRIYDHEVCGDFYCGLRGFRKESIERLNVQSQGMEFALEMLIKAELFKLNITEVPTTLSPDGRDRKPHLKTYRDGWRSLRLYLMMSPRWSFGIPGLFALLLGGILLAVSVVAPLPVGLMALMVILGPTLAIVGYQAFQLAIFTKLIAIESGLHPPATKFALVRSPMALEALAIAAVFAGVAGLVATGFAVSHIAGHELCEDSLQIVAILVTTLSLSGLTLIAGFCFGVLRLLTERRKYPRKRRTDVATAIPSPPPEKA